MSSLYTWLHKPSLGLRQVDSPSVTTLHIQNAHFLQMGTPTQTQRDFPHFPSIHHTGAVNLQRRTAQTTVYRTKALESSEI